MSAGTSSRKSFTQRDYVRPSTVGRIGIDLYSRQDTRMYHYPLAWEAFTHIRARARAHTYASCTVLEGENSRTRYTHGMSCPDWHRSCLSNRYVGLFSPSLARPLVDTLVLRPFAILRAVSRPMTLQSYGQQCALPSLRLFLLFFFLRSSRSLGSRAKPGIAARSPWRAKRNRGDIFIPMLGNPLH